ncbi:MAG TPA: hypothetical protein PKH02_03225 [Bacteroidales bacterium]|nr:hypothetical protein [Bacteroidales bacterium]HPT11960.1 hypothetical protein [Bacteroidales bacterium]
MKNELRTKLNNPLTGIIGGLLLPAISWIIFYMFTSNGLSVVEYYKHTLLIGNVTQIISVCVFTNIIIFLIFNKLDMLECSKGVLGVTILWALLVFGIKLL